jgi:putative tryptophan/tyrosine transport system substrate-binding protein
MRQCRFPILLGGLLLLILASCRGAGDLQRVGILEWSDDLIGYRQAHQGIIDGLHESGYREGFNIEIVDRNAGGSDAEAAKILRDFVRERVGVVVAIGSAACLAAKEALRESKIPLVFAVVGAPRESGIIESWAAPGWEATGVAIDIPSSVSFAKLRAVLPKAQRLAIISFTKYATAVAAAKHAAEAAPRFGFTPQLVSLEPAALAHPEAAAAELAGKVDAVYFTADPMSYAEESMKRLLPAFKAARIPVMLISGNYLRYGALLAVSSDFYNVGRQSVPHLVKVMGGMAARDIPSEGPYDAQFIVNRAAAQELGIPLSWNVLIDADAIME